MLSEITLNSGFVIYLDTYMSVCFIQHKPFYNTTYKGFLNTFFLLGNNVKIKFSSHISILEIVLLQRF